MKVAAIVPSLNPDEKFLNVVRALAKAGFSRIIAINDGSSAAYDSFFEQAAAIEGCHVLRHEQNQGKGRALKTAFEYHLQNIGEYVGVVTLDGDGQHQIDDVVRCAEALEKAPDALVLGVRTFRGDHVPTHNALGNRITSGVFKLFCGLAISDTQTGLRGISNAFARALLAVKGERYEFETNMLLETKRAGVSILEVPIQTIYLNDNETSHFRPLTDSFRIYFLIIKFALSSLLSFVLDFALFALLNWLLGSFSAGSRILYATVGARICSALFNFGMNHKVVFQSNASPWVSLLKYAALCVVQMLCSYGGVYLFSEMLGMPTLLSKIIVDCALFFISFFIQRAWVFQDAKTAKS